MQQIQNKINYFGDPLDIHPPLISQKGPNWREEMVVC